MADLEKSTEQAKALREEFVFLESALTSIGGKIQSDLQENLSLVNDEAKNVVKSVGKDIGAAIQNSTKLLDTQEALIKKINKGVNVEKELQKEISKVQKNKSTILRKLSVLKLEGIILDEEQVKALEEQLGAQENILNAIGEQNDEMQKSKSLTSLAGDAMAKFANEIDSSGTLAKLLKGQFAEVLSLQRLGELAMLAIGGATLKASKNMAVLSKETGISSDAALELQKSLNQAAINSENVAFTGQKANDAFVALTEQTGLIADFGGQTLETFSMLTTKLGMSEDAAASLTTLARLQGKETENILEDTVQTANALIKQNGVAINVKSVLKDIASVSNAIKLSLGGSPEELSEAATQAALLGTNLAGVDAIADSLLNFEDSIRKELEFQVISGKQINLEKARELALNNDLAGLAEEIADQEAITNAFVSGTRVEQEAAAAAIGLSREALGDIVMKQQLNALSAEEFKNAYGEAAYEQMQSVSAQEKLSLSAQKMTDSVAQIGLAFAPFLDGLAKGVTLLAESKTFLGIMGGLLAGLAARQAALAIYSLATAIPSIYKTFAQVPFGLGIPAAIASTIGLIAAVKGASTAIGTVDDMIMPPGYGDRILSTPAGSLALNNQDTVVAGTNLGGGANDNSMEQTNKLLSQILNKEGTVKMNATNVGTAFSVNSRQIQ